jgi:kynurenine formamidase
MSVLSDLITALAGDGVEVVDLTAPLSERTPILQLPPPFANTQSFSLQEISNFDSRGPAWYWNNFSAGEHVGTHFDAPVHWISGRDGLDVSQIPPQHLIGPAVVIDKSAECTANPDFLLDVADIEEWQRAHGPLPRGGWLLFRTGWDSRAHNQSAFLNANDSGSHTPGVSVELARWLADEAPVIGFGVETVGTDAGAAHSFEPAFPCHTFLLGAKKYGLTQLANVSRLPPTGSVLIAAPLPIVGGSGSPARVLALVPR